MYTMTLLFFLMTIPSILSSLNFILSKKMIISQEKASPFECGFDPASNNRQPFSIQFFLVVLLFLIFDVEITLLIPLIPLKDPLPLSCIILASFFLMILITGLYFEYWDESLDWKI